MAGKSTKIGPDMPGLEIAKAAGSDSADTQVPSDGMSTPAPVRKVQATDNRPKNAKGEFLAPLLDDQGKALPCEYRGTRGNLIRYN